MKYVIRQALVQYVARMEQTIVVYVQLDNAAILVMDTLVAEINVVLRRKYVIMDPAFFRLHHLRHRLLHHLSVRMITIA